MFRMAMACNKTFSERSITQRLAGIIQSHRNFLVLDMFDPYLCHDDHLEHHSFFKAIFLSSARELSR